jgi:hypothetical protein
LLFIYFVWIKRLNKKECLEIINGKNLEEIKENSFEPKKFKRVSSGCKPGEPAEPKIKKR